MSDTKQFVTMLHLFYLYNEQEVPQSSFFRNSELVLSKLISLIARNSQQLFRVETIFSQVKIGKQECRRYVNSILRHITLYCCDFLAYDDVNLQSSKEPVPYV